VTGVVVLAAVVAIEAVTVPLVALVLSVTDVGERVQVGGSTAEEGLVVRVQVREAVPA
jgi:hypothetical protein